MQVQRLKSNTCHLCVVRRGYSDYQYDAFTGDGSTVAFTLSNGGVPTNNAFVFYNGVCLKPTTDYAISGSTMTMTFAPQNASEIMVRYQIYYSQIKKTI